MQIDRMFITDWERYLRTKCNCGANTTAKFMQSFRMIVLMALQQRVKPP
ncbi:MAG: phage integrase SAM-like domain-containing protein [Alistipes communis]